MTSKRYFPQGIATAHLFCNRIQERLSLKNSILAHEHTVLMAPRRYGKTSLIAQVLSDINIPSAHIDFFFVLSTTEVQHAIAEGVSKMMSALVPKAKSTALALIETLKNGIQN